MQKKLRVAARFGLLLPALGTAIAAAACGMAERTDPEAALDQAVAGLARAESFAFSGKAEIAVDGVTVQSQSPIDGMVADQNRMYMRIGIDAGTPLSGVRDAGGMSAHGIVYKRSERGWVPAGADLASPPGVFAGWNPVEKLEQLGGLNKTVTVVRDAEDADTLTLEAVVAPEDAAALIRRELAERSAQAVSEDRIREFQNKYGLSDEEAGRLRSELAAVTERAGREMEAMTNTLQAELSYRLQLDRSTRLPQKMTIHLGLQYRAGERDHRESVKADYEFRDFNKPMMIP